MRAGELLAKGLEVGQEVWTYPMGEWPGGVATVTELRPDSAAPEIVFMVERMGWEIGVFDTEEVIPLRSNLRKDSED